MDAPIVFLPHGWIAFLNRDIFQEIVVKGNPIEIVVVSGAGNTPFHVGVRKVLQLDKTIEAVSKNTAPVHKSSPVKPIKGVGRELELGRA